MKEFQQICGVQCFQFIYNYIIKNVFSILKTPLQLFLKSCSKSGKQDTVFGKLYLENISQTINSSMEPIVLWIAKQKIIFKYSYQTSLIYTDMCIYYLLLDLICLITILTYIVEGFSTLEFLTPTQTLQLVEIVFGKNTILVPTFWGHGQSLIFISPSLNFFKS